MPPKTLTAVPAAADPGVVTTLLPALRAALDQTGPPVLPLPEDPAARNRLVAALRPDDPLAPVEADGIAVVVATSGSTGEPKGVLLSAAALSAAGAALDQLTSGPGHWLLAMPAWHVGGLQVLIRSVLAGTSPVAMDLSRTFTAEAFIAATTELRNAAGGRPTYVSLVPTQLARLLDAGPQATEALASYDAVLVGSSATSPDLAQRAREADVGLLLSYGMSETCGGCCYDGLPLSGVDVRLRDDDRILVGGATVFSGYRLRPDLTAQTLVDGWVVTPDVGRWDPHGRLEVLGRADDVVVSGGEKVSPVAVAAALRTHAAVADAAVVGQPDREWGQSVVAYVVAADPARPPDPDLLRQHVRLRLGRASAPRRVVVVESLPMLASGKVDRAALSRGEA
jgi:O-succinylbenzoic acid--CoA ligase